MQRHEEWVLTIKENYVLKPHGRGSGAECKEVKVATEGSRKSGCPLGVMRLKKLSLPLLSPFPILAFHTSRLNTSVRPNSEVPQILNL